MRQTEIGETVLTPLEILAKLAALEGRLTLAEEEKSKVARQYSKKIAGIRSEIDKLVARYHEGQNAPPKLKFNLHEVDPYHEDGNE